MGHCSPHKYRLMNIVVSKRS